MQQLHCTRADRARRRTPLLLPHYEARTEHDVLESCTDCACCREGGGACAKPSDAALVCWLQEQGELSFLSSLPTSSLSNFFGVLSFFYSPARREHTERRLYRCVLKGCCMHTQPQHNCCSEQNANSNRHRARVNDGLFVSANLSLQ